MDATELGAKLSISGQYVVLKKDVTPAVKRKISKLNLGGIVYAELNNERLYTIGTLMGRYWVVSTPTARAWPASSRWKTRH